MTIRDIGILFGYKVDQASEQKVEGSIKSLKSTASKILGAVGASAAVGAEYSRRVSENGQLRMGFSVTA